MFSSTLKSKLFSVALSFGVGLLSTSLLDSGAVQAQVSISPTIIDVESKRGQAYEFINIRNTSDETFRARVYAESFTYHPEKGFQILKSSPSDLRPYLQFSPNELVVPPRTTRKIRLNARLAPNLPDGEYRTMIFTEPLKANTVQNGKGGTTRIITRVGAIFLVRKGDISPNLAVDSATWNSEQKKLQMLVNNTGKASAFTSIKWNLKQDGKLVTEGKSKRIAMMNESKRNVTLKPSEKNQLENLTPGKYQLTGELTWNMNEDRKTLPFKVDFVVPSKSR